MLDRELARLTREAAPALSDLTGVGPDVAGAPKSRPGLSRWCGLSASRMGHEVLPRYRWNITISTKET
jgi:hypothetical protein